MSDVLIRRPFAWFGILLGVLLSGYGALQIIGACRFLGELRQTTGRVLNASIARREVTVTRTVPKGRLIRQSRTVVFRPVIQYEYLVAGQQYVGQQYDIAQTEGSEHWARKILAEFPVGSEVPVFYDPRKPDSAALTKQLFGTVWLVYAGALLSGTTFLWLCSWTLTKPKAAQTHA